MAFSISATALFSSFIATRSSSSSSVSLRRPSIRLFNPPLLPQIRSNPHRLTPPIAFSSSKTQTETKTIAVGDKIPDATLSYLDSSGDVKTVTVADLTAGKKTIFFAVPGAFTPTCSQKHVPGFISRSADLRAKGVDTIACVSVNDAFVMRAWKHDLGLNDDHQILMLSDGNLHFTRALGVELDLSDKPVGLGVRSRRYALLADDGIVKVLNLEEGGAFNVSSAEQMIDAL